MSMSFVTQHSVHAATSPQRARRGARLHCRRLWPICFKKNGEATEALAEFPGAAEAVSQVVPKLFINGEFVDAASGKTFDVICPMNEAPIVSVAEGDAADIDRAVHAARRAFDHGPWGTMSGRERGRLIYKFADLLEEHLEELAILESVDNGKAVAVARAMDIPGTIQHFRYFAGWSDKICGDTIPTGDGTLCYTLKEPVGVVGAIIPWNVPLLMFAWKVAPALAAGCTLVVKCAEQTPLTALKAAELAAQAGIPSGVLNVVPGYGPTAGAALCVHPLVDKVAFTGSLEVGRIVMKAAAERITNVSLELGGKSACIIMPDADVKLAARIAHHGLFFNHGQACCASSRIFVHESIHDEFIEHSVALAEKIKVGNPFAEGTQQGPQVDKEQFEKYNRYIKLGKEQGATLHCGGEPAADKGYYVKPSIFSNVSQDSAIFREEIFAPIMSVCKFSDLDTAIAAANDSEFGLAAGIISKDIDTIHKVTRKLKAGTVWVNTWNALDAAIPFGGYKQSGIHRDKGREALNNYLETKAVVMKAP